MTQERESITSSGKIANYFSKWTIGQWVYVGFWILTAIFLIVTIALFVVWQTSMLETVTGNKAMLTDIAIYQQNVTAAITFTTIILLIGAVFSTTVESYLKRKHGKK